MGCTDVLCSTVHTYSRGDTHLGRGLLLSLPVLTRGVPPRNVVVGGLVQMLLDVVEGVLSHIGHTKVGVLPYSALSRLQLSSEQLDHGGLASSICSNDSHTRVEGDSNADALKDLAGRVGVAAGKNAEHQHSGQLHAKLKARLGRRDAGMHPCMHMTTGKYAHLQPMQSDVSWYV